MNTLLFLLKILGILALFPGAALAILAGGLGLSNFNEAHMPPLTYLATITWWVLMLSHPFVMYKLSSSDNFNVLWWLLLPLLLHLVFFNFFGTNVSAR